MEENENVLPIVFDWTRDTTNMMVFSKRRDKYTLFRNPQVSMSYSAIRFVGLSLDRLKVF